MKIERDKVYLTRCGEKVRVICTDRPSHTHPVVTLDEGGNTDTYNSEGRYSNHGESALDLVSECVEPPKPREVWVPIYKDGEMGYAWTAAEYATAVAEGVHIAPLLVKFREVIEA